MVVEINGLLDIINWSLRGILSIFPSIILSFMVPKRDKFRIRITVYSVIVCIFIIILTSKGIVVFNASWLKWTLRTLAILIFFICNKCTIKEVIYLFAWESSFVHLSSQIPGLVSIKAIEEYNFSLMGCCGRIISATVVVVFIYFCFRHYSEVGIDHISWSEIIQSLLFTLIIQYFNGLLFRRQAESAEGIVGKNIYILQLFSALCIILLLYIQLEINYRKKIQGNQIIRNQLFEMENKYFESYQEHINVINRKCHDLKYQIEALETMRDEASTDKIIQELKKTVMIYDDSFYTGNLALDTILKEKKLQSEAKDIMMHCVVDSISLDFMDTVDLYVMLGNIFDNAFESVVKIEDKEKRMVESRIYRDKNIIRMIFRNNYEDEICFKNGLPMTTKKKNGNHGFGCESIQYIVNKYSGNMVINVDNNIFELKIMIPIPEEYRIS